MGQYKRQESRKLCQKITNRCKKKKKKPQKYVI